MLIIALVAAPAVMAAATVVERRLGPAAAGWVSALPIAFAVALVAVGLDTGPRSAATMALSAAVHVPAQVAFAVVFAHALRRWGPVVATVAAIGTYVALAPVVERLPAGPVIAVAAAGLWFAPRLMPAARLRAGATRAGWTTILTCAAATVIVLAAVLSSRLAGPAVAGAIAAFPTMCGTLAVVAVARDGADAGIHTVTGMVRSLPCYLTFAVVVGLTAPALGPAAVAIGLLAGPLAAALTWRRVPTIRASAGPVAVGQG